MCMCVCLYVCDPIRPKKLHALLEALWDFEASHGGALPAPGNKADAEAVRAKALEMLGRIPKGLFDVEICVKKELHLELY